MNKKGFTYMIAVSLLIVVIMGVFMFQQTYTFQESQESYSVRVYAINDFVLGLNNDMSRAIAISSYRSLIALEDYVAGTGTFLDDTEESFSESLFNGTIQGTSAVLMDNASLLSYLERVRIIAVNQGVNLTVSILNISLSHSDPWSVDVVVTANISVVDLAGSSAWIYEKDFTTNVPIKELRDPLYGVFTDNKIANTIRRLEGSLVNGSNVSVLNEHIEGGYYLHSTNAPSFLQRFENNFTSSPFGIESIVDIQSISDQDIIVYPSRVKVDYIYFNDLSSDSACDFPGIDYIHFIIPTNRLSLYQVDNMSYSTSC